MNLDGPRLLNVGVERRSVRARKSVFGWATFAKRGRGTGPNARKALGLSPVCEKKLRLETPNKSMQTRARWQNTTGPLGLDSLRAI